MPTRAARGGRRTENRERIGCPSSESSFASLRRQSADDRERNSLPSAVLRPPSSESVLCRPGGSQQGDQTRSHPELGRQTPQRQWYFVSRHGRVGRRQACKRRNTENRHAAPSSANPLQTKRRSRLLPRAATNIAEPRTRTSNSAPSSSVLRPPFSVLRYRGVEQPGSSSGS